MSFNDEEQPTITVECTKKAETELAIQVVIEETGEIMWLPFSQVVSMHFKKGKGEIEITEWIAEKKGLL